METTQVHSIENEIMDFIVQFLKLADPRKISYQPADV